MSLHRPHLIRWSAFMTESLEVLRAGRQPGAAPTDAYFCHLVWTHRLAEDIGVRLSMDDADAAVDIAHEGTQRVLRALEEDLEAYVAVVPGDMMQPTLRMGFCILNIYMHEPALHSDTAPPGAAHTRALAACLAAIHDTFQTFLAMDVGAIRCLPVFTFVRVAYAVVILIKMYLSAANPASPLARVVDRDGLRVAHYLEALLDKFTAAAADDKCRPASKFLLVLVMLRTWFLKHGRTPLHLLSELATGREPRAPRPVHAGPVHAGPVPSMRPLPPPGPYYQDSVLSAGPAVAPASSQPPQWMPMLVPVPVSVSDTIGFPAGSGSDFEGLGVPLDGSGDMYGGGAKMALSDPLFSDMFQRLPDASFLDF
ncbi:hypothetical protein E4U53_004416 [Claviceps sorghi]|nr:hypothetical protein E4U53_004416 [Claviceps sorghi]